MAPLSFASTSTPETLGFEETRANVVSRSVLFNCTGVDMVYGLLLAQKSGTISKEDL